VKQTGETIAINPELVKGSGRDNDVHKS